MAPQHLIRDREIISDGEGKGGWRCGYGRGRGKASSEQRGNLGNKRKVTREKNRKREG